MHNYFTGRQLTPRKLISEDCPIANYTISVFHSFFKKDWRSSTFKCRISLLFLRQEEIDGYNSISDGLLVQCQQDSIKKLYSTVSLRYFKIQSDCSFGRYF